MKKLYNKTNDFKLKMIRQIKDPASAFLDFVIAVTQRGPQRHSELFAPEFKVLLNLKKNDTSALNNMSPFVRHKALEGYSLMFNDDIPSADKAFDLSDRDTLWRHFEFCEEVISPSSANPNALTFGVRSFDITHEDYEFRRDYSQGVINTIDFDLTTLTFLGDINQKLVEWHEDWGGAYAENEMLYIEYYLDEDRRKELEDYMKCCGINYETQAIIFDSIIKNGDVYNSATTLDGIVRNIIEEISQ